MRFLKRWITILTFTALCFSFNQNVHAQEYAVSTGGGAYQQAVAASRKAPAIAFALVLLAGIIAVGVHNRSHSSHAH